MSVLAKYSMARINHCVTAQLLVIVIAASVSAASFRGTNNKKLGIENYLLLVPDYQMHCPQ